MHQLLSSELFNMTPGLWQPSVHSEVVFDPSILSLSILASLEFEVALSMLCLLASKRLLYLYQHAGIGTERVMKQLYSTIHRCRFRGEKGKPLPNVFRISCC